MVSLYWEILGLDEIISEKQYQRAYRSHLSHNFEKPTISIKKLGMSIEKPRISIEHGKYF